MLDRSSNRLQH